MPPWRTIFTLAVALALAALAAWVIAVLPRSRGVPLTSPQRRILTVAIVAFLTALIAWLLLIFPAYWD